MLGAVAALSGCGGDPPQHEASGDDRRQLDAAVEGWLSELADGNAKAACARLTDAAQEQLAKDTHVESCEDGVQKLSDVLFLEARQELKSARVTRASVRGDTAEVELDGERRFTGQAILRPLKLHRSDGAWKVDGVAAEPPGPSEVAQCNAGGMRAFDKSNVDPFWKQQGRADYRTFITRTCARAGEQGLLSEDADRAALERIAGRVMLKMVRQGRIRDPR